MKHPIGLALVSIVSIVLLSCVSCNRFRPAAVPDMEFANFVKAYTGGVISENSSVRIELVSDIQGVNSGDPAPGNLFSFSPSVKGGARWLSPNTVEFVPEQGALKAGQAYKVGFNLDKLMKISNRKFRKFPFGFMVAEKYAMVRIDNVIVSKDEQDKAAVEGTVIVSEPTKAEKVKEMISYRYKGKGEVVEVAAGKDANHINFKIAGLERAGNDEEISVSLKSGSSGFKTGKKVTAVIPGTDNEFKVMSADWVNGKTPYINIQFSKPLDNTADLNGLIYLTGTSRFYTEISDNIARLYYDTGNVSVLNLSLSESIKSADGDRMTEAYTTSFNTGEQKPEVEIPLKGNILPDTKELVLPFRAVCLKAVDLRVVKIYEQNVLTFLQDNNLDGSSDLRRSGRLVYKKTIRLDEDPSLDLHKWQDFSVDLSGLFKQEPGAIYRIRLSFKQEYSLYGQENLPGKISVSLREVTSENLSEEDKAVWDIPSPYYWNDDRDWRQYDWRDRDNPMTPSYYMDYDYPEYNLTTSDIGLIAKYSGGDRLWVTASDIMTAKPLYGVEIEAFNYQLKMIGRGKTNSDGMVEIGVTGKPFAIVAKRNRSTSYLKVTSGDENPVSRFDVGGTTLDKGLKGFIYGERGVWRPGDTLHITLLLQDKDKVVPENHPAVMELYTPQGQFYRKQICSNAKDGFYTYHVPTMADDPTGLWNAYFKVGGATFHKGLRIESLKPNRLKINLDLGTKIIDAGKVLPINIASTWLTGPSASGLAVKADMTLSRSGASFPGFEGYNFIAPRSKFETNEIRIVDTRLDGAGKAAINAVMPSASDAPGMLAANIVCSVEEAGGDASFTTMTLPFSPFSAYVGIKNPEGSKDGYLETDKDLSFKVAVVDKNGKRVSGHYLEYKIFKTKWSWWWEEDVDEGPGSYENNSGVEVAAEGNLVSTSSDSEIRFRVDYPKWGRYLVYVKDIDSGHATGSVVLIDWPAYRGRSGKTDPNALSMLSFTTDKRSYDVGETATVFVPGSADGRALVSIETASSVLKQEWVSTSAKDDTKYKFKVTADMAPNFYVYITLVQPHRNSGNDLPIRMYGVQPVLVNNAASHIEPVISMPDVIHPEEAFSLKIKEKSGKPMTYTIAIVDEGLLDLTAFKTPDAWNAMYAREALGVRTWDFYDDIIGAFSGRFSPMFSIGGDQSAIVNSKKDNRFNPVVKFLGPFTLKSGTDKHNIKLPMYIGSVRVMVVAGHGGAFGNAEKTVPVRSPLMVLPTLPRILGSGEKVVLPVNVFALEDNVKNANVTVKTEGALKVRGAAQTSVAFAQPGDKIVRFNLETSGEGMAKVMVSASGDGYKASETINIEVRNPNPNIIAKEGAMIGNGASKSFTYSPFASGDNSSAMLELASFPSMDFNGNFTYFTDYDHNCTEQLAAKGISLIYTKDFLSKENAAKAENMIPHILQELYSRQLADGGFAYWPGMVTSDTWVTSMAGIFLNAAAAKGFEVNKGVVGSWNKFQNTAVQNYRHSNSKFLQGLDQAFRLYSLALSNKADFASMNRLKESEDLMVQARLMLAATYAVSGKKTVAQEIANATDTVFTSYPVSNMTFGSTLRDKAIAVETSVLTDNIENALAVAGEIASEVHSGGISTQESAFISMAMSRLAQKSNTGIVEAEVAEGKGTAEKIKSAAAVYSKPLDPTKGSVEVKNLSSGPIYATLLRTYKPEIGQKTEAASSGLKLSVSYKATDGSQITPEKIRQGTDFTAVIQVTNTGSGIDYTNVALTQIIPSGWEIYNERLIGKEAPVASRNSFTYNDIRDDRSIWYFDLPLGTAKVFKLRLRAAYEGEFMLPATICEAMYDSRVFARTASGTAIVER